MNNFRPATLFQPKSNHSTKPVPTFFITIYQQFINVCSLLSSNFTLIKNTKREIACKMTRVYFNKSTSNVVAYSKHSKTKHKKNVFAVEFSTYSSFSNRRLYIICVKKSILNAFYRFKMYLQYDHKNCLPFPLKNKSKSIKCILLV